MKKGIELIYSLTSLSYNQSLLSHYFTEQFKLLQINDQIDMLTFNNYTDLPLLISEKLFNAFLPIQDDNNLSNSSLTKEDFTKGMCRLYSKSYLIRMDLIFSLLDYDKRHLITMEDMKLFLLHFHLINNNKDSVNPLFQKVETMFEIRNEINYNEMLQIVSEQTSDVMLLFLFYLHHHMPINVSWIDYHMKKNKTSNGNCIKDLQENLQELMTIAEPSQFLYEYLMKNYDVQFIDDDHFANSKEETNDDVNSDLDDLRFFEEDMVQIKAKYSISKHDDYDDDEDDRYINESKMNATRSRIQSCHNYNELDKERKLVSPIKSKFCSFSFENILQFNKFPKSKQLKSFHEFESKCFYIKDKETKCKGKVRIIGDFLFFKSNTIASASHHNLLNVPNFIKSKTILLKKLYVSHQENDSLTVHLYSTLKGIKEIDSFLFNDICLLQQFIDCLHNKTNYRNITDDYEIEDNIIGKGINGVIKSIMKKNTNERYVVKILHKDYNKSNTRHNLVLFSNELDSCKTLLKSPQKNIVQYYNYYEDFNNIYIIMEHIKGYRLDHFIQYCNDDFQNNKAKLTTQLINSLQSLYSLGIIHRDINLQNIMITNASNTIYNEYNMCLIDFGFSKTICRLETLNDSRETRGFVSPHALLRRNYCNKIDVWGLGVILYVFIYRRMPFNYEGKVIENILDKEPLYLEKLNNPVDEEIDKIVRMCLEKDCCKRAGIDDIYDIWPLKGI